MSLESKIKDPICIRLSKNDKLILASSKIEKDYPLEPGVMIGGEHYGFIIISDNNGKQNESIYPTQCKIEAIGIQNGILKIFEEGKQYEWTFTEVGKLKHSAFGEFTREYIDKINKIAQNADMLMGSPKLDNPLRLKISKEPELKPSVIIHDDVIKNDIPLFPGAIIGTINYGFIIIIETEKGEREYVYPTQNRIDAIGISKNCYQDLKIYENGKYNPWVFSFDGKFKQSSSYNSFSKKDLRYVEDCYKLNASDGIFSLDRKNN